MATKPRYLPLEVRSKLVEDLWDSIATEERKLPLAAPQRKSLAQRLDESELDAELGESADIVMERIRRTL